MKKHLISTIAVLVVLAVVLVSFGQEQGSGRGRGMGREERIKAIEAIEAQLAKLKEGGQRPTFDRDSFQNMSEEERTKFREQMMKVRQEQQKIYQANMGQLAGLGPKTAGRRRCSVPVNHHFRPQADPGSGGERKGRGDGQASCQAGNQRSGKRIRRRTAWGSGRPARQPIVIAVKVLTGKPPVIARNRVSEKLAL